jgi:hypothetical protein
LGCLGSSDIQDFVIDDSIVEDVDDGNLVYLDANGITIKTKDWAVFGASGVITGYTYNLVSLETLNYTIAQRD